MPDENKKDVETKNEVKATFTREELDKIIAGFKDEFKSEIKNLLNPEIKNPEGNDSSKEPDYKEKTIKSIISLMQGDVGQLRTLTGGTDSLGGYLLPEGFYNDVVKVWRKYGVVRNAGVSIIPMATKTMPVPNSATNFTASWVGENSALTTTDVTFGQVTLTLKKLLVNGALTYEMLQDNGVNLYDFIVRNAAEAIWKAEDTAMLTNSTTTPFKGILHDSNVTTVTMDAGQTAFTDITLDNIYDLMDAIPQEIRGEGVFVMNSVVQKYLRKLKNNEGSYILDPKFKDLAGNPYLLSSVMPSTSAPATPFLIFGVFKYAMIGESGTIAMETSNSATFTDADGSTSKNAWTEDLQVVKFRLREAFAIPGGEAFAILKTASV